MKLGLFKFKYGEEMIAEYQEYQDRYFVQNTAALIPTNEMSWHLVTWMPYTKVKEGQYLSKSEIWFVTELADDMATYYQNWKKASKQILEKEESEET